MKRATDRTATANKREGKAGQQAFSMSGREAISAGLTHARYTLGEPFTYTEGVVGYPLNFHSEVYPDESMRMNFPGVTIAYPRKASKGAITELDKSTLGSYIKKASRDVSDRSSGEGFKAGKKGTVHNTADETPKEKKRQAGIDRATDKLSK